MATEREAARRDLVENRRGRFEYEVLEQFEAGIALMGSEVKSLRAGQANLQDAWVRVAPDGAWLMACHISPYTEANRWNHEATRPRRLLLKRPEISRLKKATAEKGLTVVPLRFYLQGRLVKCAIAVGRGRKHHDKRHHIRDRDAKREIRNRD